MGPEEAARLVSLARAGDARARQGLLDANLGLVRQAVRRFAAAGRDPEDLFQLGCIGLIKAIDRFDPGRGFAFSTYAVPLIIGEIRRYLRDDGAVGMPRQQRALARAARRLAEAEAAAGRSPTVAELAAALGAEPAELAAALAADAPPASLEEAGGSDTRPLGERLPASGGAQAADRVVLHDLLRRLPPRERRVIALRYLLDRTQAEVGAELGVSQAQVSRLESRALRRLRAEAQGERPPHGRSR